MRILDLFIAAMAAAVMMGCTDDDDAIVTDSEKEDSGGVEVVEPLSVELRPVLTNGKRWLTEYVFPDDASKNEIREVEVVGDTVVNGLDAKILSRKCSDGTTLRYARREEGSKVFALWRTGTEYPIEYAFLQAYDICPEENIITSPVSCVNFSVDIESRGTMALCGKTRRAVKVPWGEDTEYWVEGIGPLFGHEMEHYIVLPSCFPEMHVKLLECYEGDVKIYDHAEFSEDLYKPDTGESDE